MKVILVCGSPHEKGCTYTALQEIAQVLEKENIETEIFQLGTKPISGCIACRACAGIGKCAINDKVNEFIDLAKEADGFIFGSPVHFAAPSAAITAFMDRVFYSGKQGGTNPFYLKPAAAIVSARRGGTTAAFDQLNKYFTISEMPVISSRYWNMVHGASAADAELDLEGLQTMRNLARNVAFLIKSIALGKEKYGMPLREKSSITNFIKR